MVRPGGWFTAAVVRCESLSPSEVLLDHVRDAGMSWGSGTHCDILLWPSWATFRV